jgi:hypothetical protein
MPRRCRIHRVALDATIGRRCQADLLENVVGPVTGMVAGGGQDAQVVAAGAARMETGLLEHRTAVGARTGEFRVATTGERRRAVVRCDQPEQHPQRRALASAVASEEAGDATGGDGERQLGDRFDGAEALAQPLDLDCVPHESTRYGSPSSRTSGRTMNLH